MYDEVENATCMWPIAWFHVYTSVLCFPTLRLKSQQFLENDVAFLDFSSHHISINHANTVTGFKGLDGI